MKVITNTTIVFHNTIQVTRVVLALTRKDYTRHADTVVVEQGMVGVYNLWLDHVNRVYKVTKIINPSHYCRYSIDYMKMKDVFSLVHMGRSIVSTLKKPAVFFNFILSENSDDNVSIGFNRVNDSMLNSFMGKTFTRGLANSCKNLVGITINLETPSVNEKRSLKLDLRILSAELLKGITK